MAIVINLVCWGPYAALCIYTTIFDPSTINIYITYLPAFIAKVRLCWCPLRPEVTLI